MELDRRIQAVEKKLKALEKYVRSDAFKTWRRVIGGILSISVALAVALYVYRYAQMAHARIQRVDASLAIDAPSYESPFCRWIYSDNAQYTDCLRGEQIAFIKFEKAWHANKQIGDLREQMITCFNASQNEGGISWRSAAECAELDSEDLNGTSH